MGKYASHNLGLNSESILCPYDPKRVQHRNRQSRPTPTVAEIALRLPAPHRVRAPIMNLHVRQRLGQGPEGENCRDNGGETNV